MDVSNQRTSALDALQASKAQSFERLAESGDPVVAAEQFESLFASMLVKEMRSTVEGGFFGDGPGADTYAQWFDTEMGRALAEDGGLGLADVLRRQLGVEQAALAAADDADAAPSEPVALGEADTPLVPPAAADPVTLGRIAELQIPKAGAPLAPAPAQVSTPEVR